MGLFKKIFGKTEQKESSKKGFHKLTVAYKKAITTNAVTIGFEIPDNLKKEFVFTAGQYVTISVEINDKEERRSYSICSGENEILAVGVKKVDGGKVSNWLFNELNEGDELWVAVPTGNFQLKNTDGKYVAFAAGSGITPILSMMKKIHGNHTGELDLIYGNKSASEVMFFNEIESLKCERIRISHFLSQKADIEGAKSGRITKESVTSLIKQNLDLLRSDGFYLCGPEEMIVQTKEALRIYGVAEEKIHYELFTTPTVLVNETSSESEDFKGISEVTVILDEEEIKFDLSTDGDTVLDEAEGYGVDAPYSCRGGVCSTCKGKILSGTARMRNNLSLTDGEIKEGYILTCQAHPTSEKLVISYDE